MLMCLCTVECFVIMNLSGLVPCNDCSFSESRGEIPIKGGSLSHPKNSNLDVTPRISKTDGVELEILHRELKIL